MGALQASDDEKIVRDKILNSHADLMKVVQQSIVLLRSLRHNQDEWDLASRTGYINLNELKLNFDSSISVLGFRTYQVDDVDKLFVPIDEEQRTKMKLSDELRNLTPQFDQNNNNTTDDPDHDSNNEAKLNMFVVSLKSASMLHFATTYLDSGTYSLQLDRFTLLIATWIAGVESYEQGSHTTNRRSDFESVMQELIDGLVHEEASSGGIDDIMQLTQLGSIWLTERRRLKVGLAPSKQTTRPAMTSNSKSTSDSDESNSDADFDVDDDDDDDDEDISTESAISTDSENDINNNKEIKNFDRVSSSNYAIQGRGHSDLEQSERDKNSRIKATTNLRMQRKQLRNLIENFFLHGYKCPICGDKQSAKLLACLELDSCNNCSNQLMIERCSLSFKPIPIVKLDSILGLKMQLKKLTLLSGSEWLHYYIKATDNLFGLQMTGIQDSLVMSKGSKANDNDSNGVNDNSPNEHVQITKDFQKLTVFRGSNKESEAKKSLGPRNNNYTDSDSATNSESESELANSIDENQTKSTKSWYESSLISMMKRYQQQNKILLMNNKKNNNIASALNYSLDFDSIDSMSESLKMLRFASNDAIRLPINMCDLIVMESVSSSYLQELNANFEDDTKLAHNANYYVKLGLCLNNSWRSLGSPLMSCTSESAISRLQLGCGRLFTRMELLKETQECCLIRRDQEWYKCPFCQLKLIPLKSLNQLIMMSDINNLNENQIQDHD